MQIRRSLLSHSLYSKPHISPSFPLFFFFSSSSCQEPIPVADYLLRRHQFSPESVAKLSSFPVKYLKNPEKTDSNLSFFRENGFSKIRLEQLVVRYPEILSANLDRSIKPKFEFLRELGLSPTDIVQIFSANPWVFQHSLDNRFRPSVLALRNALGSAINLSRLFKTSCGWLLCKNLESTMIPNVEFMKSIGISSSNIHTIVYNFPRFILIKPPQVRESAKMLDEMGFDRNSNMYPYALRAVGSLSSEMWECKWKLFRSLGFSEDDILLVFRKMPSVFLVSDKKIKETMQSLRSTGKFNISMIISNPALLLYSMERRIKPRAQVLEVLESKKLIRKMPSISTYCNMSNKAFLNKYVLPYLDDLGKYCIPFGV